MQQASIVTTRNISTVFRSSLLYDYTRLVLHAIKTNQYHKMEQLWVSVIWGCQWWQLNELMHLHCVESDESLAWILFSLLYVHCPCRLVFRWCCGALSYNFQMIISMYWVAHILFIIDQNNTGIDIWVYLVQQKMNQSNKHSLMKCNPKTNK